MAYKIKLKIITIKKFHLKNLTLLNKKLVMNKKSLHQQVFFINKIKKFQGNRNKKNKVMIKLQFKKKCKQILMLKKYLQMR